MTTLIPPDIWLLLSIILGGGSDGATIEEIISTGDMLNHATFTHSELEGGFYRLRENKLIVQKAQNFTPTKEALYAYDKARQKHSGWHGVLTELESSLGAAKSIGVSTDLEYEGYSKTEVDEAIERYRQKGHEFIVQSLQDRHSVTREEAERMMIETEVWHRNLFNDKSTQ